MVRTLCAAVLVLGLAMASLEARGPRTKRIPSSRNKIKLPESVRGKLKLTALPDLTIVSMTKMPAGDLRVFVRNGGSKASIPCVITVKMTAANGGPLGQTSKTLGAIQPGLSVMYTIPLGSFPGGTYLTAKADGTNIVAESNEGNNSRTIVLPNLPF